MSEDIPSAGPENLPGVDRFKAGRFASKVVNIPHNPKPLDDKARTLHAADPYAGIILPDDAESQPTKPVASSKNKKKTETASDE